MSVERRTYKIITIINDFKDMGVKEPLTEAQRSFREGLGPIIDAQRRYRQRNSTTSLPQ